MNTKEIIIYGVGGVGALLWVLPMFDISFFPFQSWVGFILLSIFFYMAKNMVTKEKVAELNKESENLSDGEKEEAKKLRNFLYVAYADGKVEKEEVLLLASLMNGKLDVDYIAKEGELFPSLKYSIYVPQSVEERNEHLSQLVAMMIIDDKQSKSEKNRIKEIFRAFGVEESKIDSSINLIVATLENSDEFIKTRETFKSFKG